MQYQVTDLIQDPNGPTLLEKFKEYISKFCQDDPLYENYANLELEDFVCLTAVLDTENIIGLSGIQYNTKKWGHNTLRISTRFWMHPDHRIATLSKYQPNSRLYFNSQLMIPYQLNYVKESNKKFAIITREGNYRKSFGKFIDLVNHHNNTEFKLLDGIYNVCEPMCDVPDSCRQMVAVYAINGDSFEEELELLNLQDKLISI